MKSSPKEPVYKKCNFYLDDHRCPSCGSADITREPKKISSTSLKRWIWCIFSIAIIVTVGLLVNIFRGDFSFATDWSGLLVCLAIWSGFIFSFVKIRKFESTYHSCYTCHKCNNHWYVK